MRIDLHCHTKKVKTGDAYTRNVTKDKFFQKVIEAEVKIIAITNHNQFDYIYPTAEGLSEAIYIKVVMIKTANPTIAPQKLSQNAHFDCLSL